MKRLLLLAFLAGCGSGPPAAKTPEDAKLVSLGHAGDIAFSLEQADQAADQYRLALARARERDDASAIADAGFDLAVAELRQDNPRDAMRTAQELRSELSRRGVSDPDFSLVVATAQFRLGNLDQADRTAAALSVGTTPALADSAWFLRGLVADARGDRGALHQSLAALSPTADAGDRAELQARIAHDPALALHAADFRRDALDYRGMSRNLALAAQFTPEREKSADLYLRAGQSAAARRDASQARKWISEARSRSADPSLRAAADQALKDLNPARLARFKPPATASPH